MADPTDEQLRTGRRFLAATALGALNTAHARSPLVRNGRAGVAAFGPGWLTSELPLQAIGWQALATAAFAARGALRTWPGRLGLGLSAASWATLWRIHQEASAAGHVLTGALHEGLGSTSGQAPAVATEPATITGRQIAMPIANLKRRYVHQGAISYGEAGRRNHLDVWCRGDLPDDARAPVLLQIHGGAWVIGNKDQQGGPLMAHMAERGWVCVAINYRLSPRSTWPDQIIDVKRAIAWIRDHIADHGGDPRFLAVTGGSAGGHLAALAALTPNEAAFQPDLTEADTTVEAAVPFYGVYDFTNRDGTGRADMEAFLADRVFKVPRADAPDTWAEASPMSWVGPAAPPFMVVHGTNDTLVPVAQARSFADMLRAASPRPVVYAELPGAQHAFDVFGSVRTLHTVAAVGDFLAEVRARAGRGAVPPA